MSEQELVLEFGDAAKSRITELATGLWVMTKQERLAIVCVTCFRDTVLEVVGLQLFVSERRRVDYH